MTQGQIWLTALPQEYVPEKSNTNLISNHNYSQRSTSKWNATFPPIHEGIQSISAQETFKSQKFIQNSNY